MKHLVALALVAFLLPAVAILLPATVSTLAVAKDKPCKQDRKKLCKGAKGVAAGDCLNRHKDELSAECKAYRDKKKADWEAEKKKDNPTEPAASQSETPSEQEMMPGGSDGASE